MIKLEHTVVPSPQQMGFIIEGMRNPMNSWDKSDSFIVLTGDSWEEVDYSIGENDHRLMRNLAKAGTDHRKYMRMMVVYVRITAPLYWWKEFDTYKVGTVSNSCSTMHKIHAKEFTWDDFSLEHLKHVKNCSLGEIVPTLLIETVINELNYWRKQYLKTNSKEDWWQIIQLLPSSYNQTRNVMLNYETLTNIYKSRKNHKLDEWREFCDWIETLPHSELITEAGNLNDDSMNTKKNEAIR